MVKYSDTDYFRHCVYIVNMDRFKVKERIIYLVFFAFVIPIFQFLLSKND